jgi:hypothetical protein
MAAAGDAAKVVLIDVDYKAAPLLSFSRQQHRVDRRRRERLAALIHNATLSQLGEMSRSDLWPPLGKRHGFKPSRCAGGRINSAVTNST